MGGGGEILLQMKGETVYIQNTLKLENFSNLPPEVLASTCFSHKVITWTVSLQKKIPVQHRNYCNQYIKITMG